MYAFEGMPPSDLLQVSILYILANFREKVVERTQNLLSSSIKLNEYQHFKFVEMGERESEFGWNQEILRLYVF